MIKSNRNEVIEKVRWLDTVFIVLPFGGMSYELRNGKKLAYKNKDGEYFLVEDE